MTQLHPPAGGHSAAPPVLAARGLRKHFPVRGVRSRAVVHAAAYAVDNEPRRNARQAAVSRCKLRAADAAMVVARTCIQLHGGIGYTDAADIGLFLRKAMVLAPLYGGAMVHRGRFRITAPEQDNE